MTRMIAMMAAGLVVGGTLMAGDSWPQFRGPAGSAIATGTLPDKLGPNENLRWKIDLPGRGLSCPAIAGGRIFLTANSGMDQNRLHVLAYDQASGKTLWERQFASTGQTLCHPKTCMACPTVATDGRMVYALFATGDMVSLTVDGDVKWVRSFPIDYPKMTNHVGRSSSPVLAGGVLAVLMENQGESYLFGIDPAHGETKWKIARPGQNNWNTPLVLRRGDAIEIVVSSYDDAAAYDAATGAVRWSIEEKRLNPVASPVAADGLVIIPAFGQMIALRPSENGAEVVWKSKALGTDTPSPVVVDGKIYSIARGVLKCGNLADGKLLGDVRVAGPHSASPVYADGRLYLVNEEGVVAVVKAGEKPEVASTSELKDTILATPAVADGAIFLRSDKHLWCFGKPG